MPDQPSAPSKRAAIAAVTWLAVAVAGVYFLGGGAWFFGGIWLGWLGAVIALAVSS